VHSPAEHAEALWLRYPIGIAAIAANQTLTSLRPARMTPAPIAEISEISDFLFSSTTTLPPPSLVYLPAHP
jgi:hypothetical protein